MQRLRIASRFSDSIHRQLNICALVGIVVFSLLARAQTFKTLYSFKGGRDGAYPGAGLVRDRAGNLYGTTHEGGAFDFGTVFKLTKTGHHTVLHSFKGGADGAYTDAGLVRDAAGNLYGTTYYGGTTDNGTVFKVTATGVETVLYSFAGGTADGANPEAGLIQDTTGNFYGTTYGGGPFNDGTIFKLDTTGTETVLFDIRGNPYAGLIQDAAGNLYGTTYYGGGLVSFPAGNVFKLDTTGTETDLYDFNGAPGDGGHPYAGLIQDAAGNFYGTTYFGSDFQSGIVFKLDTMGVETHLYAFTGKADGANPQAGLIRDAAGNLYGTAYYGGAFGNGVVFKLDTTGVETVLHSFTGKADGSNPAGPLVRDKAGNLYGTTTGFSSGSGTVFKITP